MAMMKTPILMAVLLAALVLSQCCQQPAHGGMEAPEKEAPVSVPAPQPAPAEVSPPEEEGGEKGEVRTPRQNPVWRGAGQDDPPPEDDGGETAIV